MPPRDRRWRGSSTTATRPGVCRVYTNRVEDDVAGDAERIRVLLDQPCLEAALDRVADPAVPPIETARVDAVQLPHPEREVRAVRLDHEVKVVAHQAVRVADPAVPLDDLREAGQQPATIAIVAEDRRPLVPARVDVVEGVLELHS